MINRSLVLSGSKQNPTVELQSSSVAQLPVQGNTLVRIAYSSLNFKDGLAITGKGKIVRSALPFIPGIDLVGEIVETSSADFFPGDWVIGTGWGIGEEYFGGYSQHQWLMSDWLVPLPAEMSPLEAMTAGTAGLTAMIAVSALEHQGLTPTSGKVLVSGASGGVGSFSVAILGALGYTVVASTGKKAAHDYLHEIGASEILDRSEFSEGPQHPMESARWAGAVDSVGDKTLETIIAQLQRHASVAVCGLAAGHRLSTTVFPFILRGANLLGIDSNTCPNTERIKHWSRLATMMRSPTWKEVGSTVSLSDLPHVASEIVQGKIRGRIVVDVNV